jgi:hypothetical protein
MLDIRGSDGSKTKVHLDYYDFYNRYYKATKSRVVSETEQKKSTSPFVLKMS